MITDTITEKARDQIRQMQGEIDRLTKQLVCASEAAGARFEEVADDNWNLREQIKGLRAQLVRAQASVDFCGWLRGYFAGITGRDELTPTEANTIRGNLNEMVFPPAPLTQSDEKSE